MTNIPRPGEVFDGWHQRPSAENAVGKPQDKCDPDESALSQRSDEDETESYKLRSVEILRLATGRNVAELLQQPEFMELGWEIGRVKFYNPTKGFGFVTVSGEDVFFGNYDRLHAVAGLHSVPDHKWNKYAADEGPVPFAEIRSGDTILINTVYPPREDDRNPRRGKPKVNPTAAPWVHATEYTQAIRDIYSRAPKAPGMYCDGELYVVDKPWSLPHHVLFSHRDGNSCLGKSPCRFDEIFQEMIDRRFLRHKEFQTSMLSLALENGLRGGKEEFAAQAEAKLNELSQQKQRWLEAGNRLASVQFEVEDGEGTLRIGSIELQVTGGKVPTRFGSSPWRYGMDDEEDVAYIRRLDEIGGVTWEDIEDYEVWECLHILGREMERRDHANKPMMTRDEIQNMIGECCRQRAMGEQAKMTMVGEYMDLIFKARGTGGIDCNPEKSYRRKLKPDWRAELQRIRGIWAAQDAAAAEKMEEEARLANEAHLVKSRAEQGSRVSRSSFLSRLDSIAARLAGLQAKDPKLVYHTLDFTDLTYFGFGHGGVPDLLYTEPNIAYVERSVEKWENELTKRLSLEQASAEYRPQFEMNRDRAEALGWTILFGEAVFNVEGVGYYPYDKDGFSRFVERLSLEENNRAEFATAQAERDLLAMDPALTNFGGTFRERGAKDNSNFWVIRPDGTERVDQVVVGKYQDSGRKSWGVVGKEEVAICWQKLSVAAPHMFTVEYLPPNGPTPEQVEAIRNLEQIIARQWSVYDERKNDPRGDRSSPPIGRGWKLDPQSAEKEAQRNALMQTVEAMIDQLEDLGDNLESDLQKRRNALLGRADRLLETSTQVHHEYPNQVKQLTSLVEALINDVEARDAERMTGEVSSASLEALRARFNNS